MAFFVNLNMQKGYVFVLKFDSSLQRRVWFSQPYILDRKVNGAFYSTNFMGLCGHFQMTRGKVKFAQISKQPYMFQTPLIKYSKT